MNYLKVGKASHLTGRDKKLYRGLEMLPGFLSWATLLILIILSGLEPVWVAIFLLLFDIFWLLQVIYLAIHLIGSYKRLRRNEKLDWVTQCASLTERNFIIKKVTGDRHLAMVWTDLYQVVILPTYNESLTVLRKTFQALANDPYPKEKQIVVLAMEERAGESRLEKARAIEAEFGSLFGQFLITVHPDGIAGEIKGKGANQAYAASELKRLIIDPRGIDEDQIVVSVFDIDTVIKPGYFHCLVYRFFRAKFPHRSSYQPIPVYNNNVWQAPFFARIAAFSNTFWQMMLQLQQEKLATYSSHSMSWRTLTDIGFWSPAMVSEDSRIFFHAYFHYQSDYRVEPMYFPVFMDACQDKTLVGTAGNLYKQQRRWGWGCENVPYIIFNTIKSWAVLPKYKSLYQIWIQIYGFHSWATNALIIGVIGWLPLFIGGDKFNASVLSVNLPAITQSLMTLAMIGMVLSAIVSTIMLPERPRAFGVWRWLVMIVQWMFLPISIIIFGSIPGLDAQTRLMFGKYMGFWVTPKER
jgi:cellulose synthase/poly-beta-1,6-N-acetylglucosamine synthase-like glycosyltransferase